MLYRLIAISFLFVSGISLYLKKTNTILRTAVHILKEEVAAADGR
jgi:uncharacterized membrane protein